ncbi:hypothetical protein KCU81_g5782, partial [Aureobasidium melanogenum]|uniref:Uncharacterized protein n=1 Tax=Aureobasidium melanogenum (strain CBS 110374) TaxID=1043003 RepID=A0A074VVP0_AURM1
MTVHTEPLVDHEEAYDSDDCVDIDGFTPSLPTLTTRLPESDARSVSDVGSNISGDTISEHASDAEYDEINYDEIPALAVRARYQETEPSAEEMEHVTMSDRTIIPDTPTMAQRMPHITSEPAIKPNTTPEHARVVGLSLAEKPYQLPDRPLRLVYLGDTTHSNMDVVNLMAKFYGAMTGNSADEEAMLDAASCAPSDEAILHSLSDLPSPVQIDRASTFDVTPGVGPAIEKSDGSKSRFNISRPDLVVLHRANYDNAWVIFAKMVADQKIPMVEVQDESFDISFGDTDLACVIPQTAQGEHCLRLSLAAEEDEKVMIKEVPLSESAFHAFEYEILSRHLAYLTDMAKELDAPKMDESLVQSTKLSEPYKLMSLLNSLVIKKAAQSLFALLVLLFAASLPVYFLQQQSPASELAHRTSMLQAALNSSGLANVNASDVLHYPVTASIIGNSKTTALAFPTTVHVHVAKSDQLLVSLPKAYWKSAQIGVFKNGKTLANVNNTRVVDGVLAISLPSTDAYGQVQISVLSTHLPLRNETVKVDLGNRLLQRATYENAAKGVQQDVTVVHNAAKLAQAKVFSDVHSVFNTSVYCVRSLGSNLLGGVKSTGDAISAASNHTSHSLSYVGGLAYNKTSDLGAFVKSAIPQRRHFIRARNNALKIRTRLLRKSTTAKHNIIKPKPGLSQSLASMKMRFAELQKKFSSFNALKRSTSVEKRSKAIQTASKVKLSVKTVVEPKIKKAPSSTTDAVKIAKRRKQCKNTDKKLKSCV